MSIITNFSDFIKTSRRDNFIKPYDLAYTSFIHLGLNNQPNDYFFHNASSIIESMREECWKRFLDEELKFSQNVYKELAKKDDYSNMTPENAVNLFIDNHAHQFYELSLSNTQSRRSRAGTEFESIVELLFIGAGLMIDSQGFLSSGIFEEHNLGKAVDFISPGVLEYGVVKRNCSLISCKTTLRERWSEVIEEKNRTGASEIFLATLDSKISANTQKILTDNNVILVVTKSLKSEFYSTNRNIITYEDLLNLVNEKHKYWFSGIYAPEILLERIELIDRQIAKHNQSNHEYVSSYYMSKRADLICQTDME